MIYYFLSALFILMGLALLAGMVITLRPSATKEQR